MKWAAVCVLALPVVVYFWFIHRYNVNAVWYDQWWRLELTKAHAHQGGFSCT